MLWGPAGTLAVVRVTTLPTTLADAGVMPIMTAPTAMEDGTVNALGNVISQVVAALNVVRLMVTALVAPVVSGLATTVALMAPARVFAGALNIAPPTSAATISIERIRFVIPIPPCYLFTWHLCRRYAAPQFRCHQPACPRTLPDTSSAPVAFRAVQLPSQSHHYRQYKILPRMCFPPTLSVHRSHGASTRYRTATLLS